MKSRGYDHLAIEKKWGQQWKEAKLFDTPTGKGEKMYLLFAFPYPSGSGLHVGHAESMTALDIMARYYRMRGRDVFFPMGWDSFGLPAENYAIKMGIVPQESSKTAIDTFKRQIRDIGISYSWDHELATSHPGYYKWTQWLFLKLYEKGLAYRGSAYVNWCPSCQTVLANEQVVDGLCERCDSEVEQRQMEQWFFKITEYADELLEGLEDVDWPKATEAQQKNWIGKSEGIEITYEVDGTSEEVTCFTTRPDTNYGATFIVLAPEHQLGEKIISGEVTVEVDRERAVATYIKEALKKTERQRQEGGKKKSGVFTGLYGVNQLNGYKMPIYIADFVLSSVGTGAVVGVPGHDKRDFDFAKEFDIPVKRVVIKSGLMRSYLMGAEEITDEELVKIGVSVVDRTESGSRRLELPSSALDHYQQLIREKLSNGYWNEVVGEEVWFCFKSKTGVVSEHVLDENNVNEIAEKCSELNGDPIEKTKNIWAYLAGNEWYEPVIVQEDEGKMVGSGFLDGMDIHTATIKMMNYLVEKGWGKRVTTYRLRDWLISRQRYWGAPIPIVYDPDGKSHSVKQEHLPWMLPTDVEFKPEGESPLKGSKELKSRVEELYGKGWTPEYDTMDTFVDSSWYFLRYPDARNEEEIFSQDSVKAWLPPEFYMIGPEHIVLHLLYSRFLTKFLKDEGIVEFAEPFPKMRHQGIIMGPDGKRMSKSRGNVVNPDDVISAYGADTLRIYEMFMGPIDADKPWDTSGVVGARRFLERVYRLLISDSSEGGLSDKGLSSLHKALKKVGSDIEELKFNTAIASMMEMMNEIEKESLSDENKKMLVLMIAPFAPFIAEEVWHSLGEKESVHLQAWPEYDEKYLVEDIVSVVVQVNGKLRHTLELSVEESKNEEVVVDQALASEQVKKWVSTEPKKTVFVSGKLVNFVVVE